MEETTTPTIAPGTTWHPEDKPLPRRVKAAEGVIVRGLKRDIGAVSAEDGAVSPPPTKRQRLAIERQRMPTRDAVASVRRMQARGS